MFKLYLTKHYVDLLDFWVQMQKFSKPFFLFLILCNVVLRNIIFELTDTYLRVWHKMVNYNSPLLANTEPLVNAPFILSYDLLTSYQLTC